MESEGGEDLLCRLSTVRDAYAQNVPLTMAGATIVMLPIIVIYLIFQRKFIQGLTSGAVK